MNISSNISSIQSHQQMLSTNANNIANVNTDGFVPSSTKMSNNGNYVSANDRVADKNSSTKSQTDLAKEIPDQMIAQDAVAVNVKSIKTQNEMLGSLLDLKA